MYKQYPRELKYLKFILKMLKNNHVIIIFMCKLILELMYMWVKLGKKIIFMAQSISEYTTGKSKINCV